MIKKIKKGFAIRNSFETPFEEIRILRKMISLLIRKVDLNNLTIKDTKTRDEFKRYDKKVKDMLEGLE